MIKDLTSQEFRLIERYLLYPELRPVISAIIRDNLNLVNVEADIAYAYPNKIGIIDDIGKMSSKVIRQARTKEVYDPIWTCINPR